MASLARSSRTPWCSSAVKTAWLRSTCTPGIGLVVIAARSASRHSSRAACSVWRSLIRRSSLGSRWSYRRLATAPVPATSAGRLAPRLARGAAACRLAGRAAGHTRSSVGTAADTLRGRHPRQRCGRTRTATETPALVGAAFACTKDLGQKRACATCQAVKELVGDGVAADQLLQRSTGEVAVALRRREWLRLPQVGQRDGHAETVDVGETQS